MIDGILRLRIKRIDIYLPAIKEDRIDTGMEGTGDIGVVMVADHERLPAAGAGLLQRIVEERLAWLVGSGILTEDDRREERFEATRPQFPVLHLVEAIAADMHPITFRLEINEQVTGALYDARLAGDDVAVTVADGHAPRRGDHQRVATTLPDHPCHGLAEPLNDECVSVDFAMGILLPYFVIRLIVCVTKGFERRHDLLPLPLVEEFPQSNHTVAVGVVERVIEVDEQVVIMFICHTSLSVRE